MTFKPLIFSGFFLQQKKVGNAYLRFFFNFSYIQLFIYTNTTNVKQIKTI